MIRYVLAALLTVAIVGISMGAIGYGATVGSERRIDADVAAIDRAATALFDDEELPPAGGRGPRRVVTVSLPEDSITSAPLESFELERTRNAYTTATYRVEGGTERTRVIAAPIVHADANRNRTLELEGTGADVRLVLVLERDPSGDPVIAISRA